VRLYLEDFAPGQVRESAPRTLTKDEIVAFAREYDPQPFHVDEEAAARSVFGGLIASGWQTVGIMMRLMWDTFLKDTASLGSPGSDEIRWLQPVRPGDTLRARFTVLEVVPSRSKPDRGIVHTRAELFNQHGALVMTQRGLGMFGRRPRG
jgi:acyl dehydratase